MKKGRNTDTLVVNDEVDRHIGNFMHTVIDTGNIPLIAGKKGVFYIQENDFSVFKNQLALENLKLAKEIYTTSCKNRLTISLQVVHSLKESGYTLKVDDHDDEEIYELESNYLKNTASFLESFQYLLESVHTLAFNEAVLKDKTSKVYDLIRIYKQRMKFLEKQGLVVQEINYASILDVLGNNLPRDLYKKLRIAREPYCEQRKDTWEEDMENNGHNISYEPTECSYTPVEDDLSKLLGTYIGDISTEDIAALKQEAKINYSSMNDDAYLKFKAQIALLEKHNIYVHE